MTKLNSNPPENTSIHHQQINRVSKGLVDQSKTISFYFNQKKMNGFEGDTLASALLANNKIFVARSFKYHRPRGIFSSGTEEPNALVQLGEGENQEPNTKATSIELFDGLYATSQNHRGPLEFDFMAINDFLSPFLSAGFYYKTFMWPKSFWEKIYEPIIRSSAGLGSLSGKPDPSIYDKGFLHCDLLIIGSGPAGISAALQAGRSKLNVILADDDYILGGRINSEKFEVNNLSGNEWVSNAISEIKSMSNIRVMSRTTIYGAFDHGVFGALERKTDHIKNDNKKPRQILWRIYSKRSLLASGSTERSIAFGNNDRPGIMLSGAVRSYLNRWGVAPGKNIALFTNNDDGWRTAIDFQKQGINVSAIIDSRENLPDYNLQNTPIFSGQTVTDTFGRHRIKKIKISNGEEIKCDCLAVSGGWNPNVHLTCHQNGKPKWQEEIQAFVPGDILPVGMKVIGAANGILTLNKCLSNGFKIANEVIVELGKNPTKGSPPKSQDEKKENSAFWYVKGSSKRAWVDLQNDVTSKDIEISYQEGFRSVEHLKRYSTLGMATDQGKTSNILGLAILSEMSGKAISQTGTTIFRPPYTPVPIGAFAGRSRGKDFRPIRLTPSHDWAKSSNAVFVEVGAWMRAQWYAQKGENHWRQSVDREVNQTRASVGICDVTTLGKIDIQGKDSADFLNKVYANGFALLPVNKVRYGLMLREDGVVMDDGTTARLGENHFVMTTTTANAVSVFRHMEFCRQCLWPKMDVHLISVTEQWAQFAVAGPNSRNLLKKIIDIPFDISNEAFPFMACGEINICNGIPARLFRISFSGELAYEIAVPSKYGNSLMEVLINAGNEFDAIPYGTEALGVMRVEKGHAAGNELNGQTTAQNLNMSKFISKKKDCIGNVLSERSELNKDDKIILMGFKPVHNSDFIPAGSHFISKGNKVNMDNDEGWVSSAVFSPTLGHSIALGFIKKGNERIGEIVKAVDPLRDRELEVEIVSHHFVDPNGDLLRG